MHRSNLFLLFTHLLLVLADLGDDLQSQGISASLPGDANFEVASQAYNQRCTVEPAAVTYPNTAEDVSKIVKIGSQQGLHVVARSGGHSYIANGLGGANGALVIDMRNMKNVSVDSTQGSAVIETGNRLGDVATQLNNAGRALPHGTCPYVGIGGHSAFGGFGFTSRMWGLTLDTITAVNLVLPNGTIARATQQSYPDLFWGLRGAAPSFGIVTSVEVNTFPAPTSATAFVYTWNLNVDDATNGLAAFQSFVQTNIPQQFGAEINLGRGPSQGTVYFSLVGGWYGPEEDLQNVLAPLLSQLPANPQTELHPGSYIESVAYFGGGSLDTTNPDATDNFYAKSLMTPQSSPMSTEALQGFISYLANDGFQSDMKWFCQVELYGGTNSAINNVPADATAFPHRSSIFTLQLYATKPDSATSFPDYGYDFVDGIANSIISNSPANWPYGAYSNYIDDRLTDWETRYYGSSYDRLRTLKAQIDPQDTYGFPTAIE